MPAKKSGEREFPWAGGWALWTGLAYTASFGGSYFFRNAVWWDDWTLFNMSPAVNLDVFRQNGSMFDIEGRLHNFLAHFGPSSYRFLAFFLMLSAGASLYGILRDEAWLSTFEKRLLTALFLLAPVNPARVALINFPYLLDYACFFFAWYLLVRKKTTAATAASLVLFFFSFNTNSLLMFYTLPFVHAFANEVEALDAKGIMAWLGKRFLFLIVPFAYFALKKAAYAPYGVYAGYNALTLGGIKVVVLRFVPFFGVGLVALVSGKARNLLLPKTGLFPILLGLLSLWLAVSPYTVVGLIPQYIEWNSRHQLLMPLGVALICIGILRFAPKNVATIASIAVVAIFVALNMNFAFEYFVDFSKQEEIMRKLRASAEVRSAHTLLFQDNTQGLNARGRHYRFYEYNGWLKLIFGDESRFMLGYDTWEQKGRDPRFAESYARFFAPMYNAGAYKPGNVDLIVRIDSTARRTDFIFGSGDQLQVSFIPAPN